MNKIESLLKIDKKFILASKSPRRKKLLGQIGIKFEIMESNVDEKEHPLDISPQDYAEQLAFKKAEDVANRINIQAIVLGADTIVVLNNEILNKPEDKQDAFNILKKLSGNTHLVITGIALIDTSTGEQIVTSQKTEVTFRNLTDEEIEAYIETCSPMDKAGAYGIQDDFGAVFISHINGCYYNIVGLPLELLYRELKKFVKY